MPNARYSTDIAASWQVVEKVHSRNLIVLVELWPSDVAKYEVMVERLQDQKPFVFETADTAPLAICRAALLAVMDKK
jgi:hypothetical protein